MPSHAVLTKNIAFIQTAAAPPYPQTLTADRSATSGTPASTSAPTRPSDNLDHRSHHHDQFPMPTNHRATERPRAFSRRLEKIVSNSHRRVGPSRDYSNRRCSGTGPPCASSGHRYRKDAAVTNLRPAGPSPFDAFLPKRA